MVNNVLDLEKTDVHMIEYKADRKARCISDRYGIINYMKELHIDNVIHVGCCGHPYYIEKRIKENRWLQAKFESAFSGVIGTDINNEAVGLVKSVRSESKVYLLDMISDSEKIKEIIEKEFQPKTHTAIVLPEVLEHINNPIEFLSKLNNLYRGYDIILTVPNAYSWHNIKNIFMGVEKVNSDHKTIFSEYSLVKTFVMSGIKPIEIFYTTPTLIPRVLGRRWMCSTMCCYGQLEQ